MSAVDLSAAAVQAMDFTLEGVQWSPCPKHPSPQMVTEPIVEGSVTLHGYEWVSGAVGPAPLYEVGGQRTHGPAVECPDCVMKAVVYAKPELHITEAQPARWRFWRRSK